MRRQEQLHDPQPRLRSHRREHIGILGHAFRAFLGCAAIHISTFAEIWMLVNPFHFLQAPKGRHTTRNISEITRFAASFFFDPLDTAPIPTLG
jgi:hypothetical protein